MRTSLNDIKLIEQYSQQELTFADRVDVEQRLLVDERFRLNLFLQRKVYRLLHLYRRKHLKESAQRVHEAIFNEPENESFRARILHLF